MKLVIVESPTKAKTLAKILGKDYVIEASYGHVRDLPKKGLGVEIDNNFNPIYEISPKSLKHINAIKKNLKNVDGVILATDPDREGEAIAWHIKQILSEVKKYKNLKFDRVVFHELTKNAVLDSFSHPTTIKENLVDSQQARRVLDRLVGYKLSPLLWKKVRYGLSAGRVQSVAVRLIVEREEERKKFKVEEYWKIKSNFIKENDENIKFEAEFVGKDNRKIKLENEKQVKELVEVLKNESYEVSKIKRTKSAKKPYAPYKTSTLQQTMANIYGMSAKNTMSAAQKLFENGLITYHRTDSISLSDKFIKEVRNYIQKNYGDGYLSDREIHYKTKSKNAQEAHEAIRPTDVGVQPNDKKITKLKENERKTYLEIWKRSLECQMSSIIYDNTRIDIHSSNNYIFKANGSTIISKGWLVVGESIGVKSTISGGVILPEINEHDILKIDNITPSQHFTQPPARYSDASLIKTLEELGIGRPSTYAPTISTIISRGYVYKDQRYFVPNEVSFVVINLLKEHFSDIVDYEFTANMEKELDEIAEGLKKWQPVIKKFYEPFEKTLLKKEEELSKRDVTTLEVTDEKCPDCGHVLNVKLGKYGKFLSCSNYPDCKFAKPLSVEEQELQSKDYGKCDKCDSGSFVLKQGRFGKFLACSNYPKCKNTKPFLEKIGKKCTECGDGEIVVKKAKGRIFYGCSNYPKCEFSSWKKP